MAARLERLLQERGLDPHAVLDASATTRGLGPDARIPYAAVDDAIERAAASLGAAGLGLALARVRDDAAYGAAGLLLATSDNLRSGLRRAFTYQRLWGDCERFKLREARDHLSISFQHPGGSALACAVLAECALVEILESARLLVQRDAVPLRVAFAHEPLATDATLSDYFGVAPSFGQPESAIVLDATLVDRPLELRRELLRAAFENQCRQALRSIPGGTAIGVRVRSFLAEMVDGRLTLASVAARLRMSARTLQRKLEVEGTSFQELADELRRDRAGELLRAGRSKKEVAVNLGFADPSGFQRARRRWRERAP